MNPILGKTQSQPQQPMEPSPAKRSSSGSTLRRMKSEKIFGSHQRGGEGNHSQNNRIEVPKVVKAIHNEKTNEDHSPIVSADQIEIEVPSSGDTENIQLLNLKQQPSTSDESQGASSRVPKSLLLDNFLSKSKERIASGNSLSPK